MVYHSETPKRFNRKNVLKIIEFLFDVQSKQENMSYERISNEWTNELFRRE